jgi:spermidine/putrescine transport system substrate-binding protein
MVITKASANPEAAHKFIDFVLDPENGAWVASNILYKVPSKAAMDAIDPALLTTYPNLAMAPAELIKLEQLRDVGPAQKAYARAVSEIMAAQ